MATVATERKFALSAEGTTKLSRFNRLVFRGLGLVVVGIFLSFWQPTDGPWRPPTPTESSLFNVGGILELLGFSLVILGFLPLVKLFLSELGLFRRRKP